MASFTVEEFVGNGVLKEILPKLVEDGWDDVPTLKMMNPEDMDASKMTTTQKVAMEIRSYLHDRSLMQYADRLEASGKSLTELLNCNASILSYQFGMKRGHIARFIGETATCVSPHRKRRTPSVSTADSKNELSFSSSQKIQTSPESYKSNSTFSDISFGELRSKEGYPFKGIIASAPAESRLCGLIRPAPIADDVAPYSMIVNIAVEKLAPEYKFGMRPLRTLKATTMKASNLWRDRPAVLLCIRRPGCIMCRAEAHQLYSKKPFFDAKGVQLIAVIHEQIEAEVYDFWPRYWGGMLVLDRSKGFFKALGGGKLLTDNILTGFLLNPRAVANYWRAKASGLKYNFNGDGNTSGGLFVVGNGKSGIAYQFVERNFGDWAPIAEVIEICSRLQK